MRLQLTIDDTHTVDLNLTSTSDLMMHVNNEHEFREQLAALVAMRAPQEGGLTVTGTTSWVDFSFPIGDAEFDLEITLFVPDAVAPSEARAILAEVQREARQ